MHIRPEPARSLQLKVGVELVAASVRHAGAPTPPTGGKSFVENEGQEAADLEPKWPTVRSRPTRAPNRALQVVMLNLFKAHTT